MWPTSEGGVVDVFCSERAYDQGHDGFRDLWATTGENIHRRVAMFGPCVNGDMAFRDDDHSTHPLRGKMVEVG